MQQHSFVWVGFLIVGLALGYWIGAGQAPEASPQSAHVMPDGSTMAEAMTDMSASLRGKTGDALDRAFIDEMIVHHEGAVEMAQLLLAGTKRPELLKLGNDIVSAQTGEIEMMKRWRAEWFAH
jgi:uncharacterized protein (DUF305 family)